MSYREQIVTIFNDVLEQTDSQLKVEKLTDDVILLDSGLDSLGFAILVAQLDEEIDIDPFAISENPEYPTTFGQFVAAYDKHFKE